MLEPYRTVDEIFIIIRTKDRSKTRSERSAQIADTRKVICGALRLIRNDPNEQETRKKLLDALAGRQPASDEALLAACEIVLERTP